MKYTTKCRRCGKGIRVEWNVDYDDEDVLYRDEDGEYCAPCKKKNTEDFVKERMKEVLENMVFIKGIKPLSSKKEFVKWYNSPPKGEDCYIGVKEIPNNKEKCRFCGGTNLFEYVLNDWEYMTEVLCMDCMEKIIVSVRKQTIK